jgi:hypothetical protein
MTLFGLDLNAGRARMVAGPPGDYAYPVPLEPPHAELPLAVSLAGERPEAGTAGLRLCRRAPHLARTGLLSALAEPVCRRASGKLDDGTALSLVLRRLARACRHCEGGVVAVPAYLSQGPLGRLFDLAERAGLPLLGCVASPLALALVAHAERGWAATALVVEADEQALTLSTVTSGAGQAHLRATASFPRLGLRVWRERLLNAVADRCILQSRRDPRDCAEAEQALFDRLDELLDACRHGRALRVPLQARSWYQSILMRPEDTAAACAALARGALERIEEAWAASGEGERPGAVIVCAAAARLPGLVAVLQERFVVSGAEPRQATRLQPPPVEDFGEGLLEEEGDRGGAVLTLGPDAVSRAAHGLAAHFGRGELPPGHLDVSAPLPLPLPAEAGPGRLEHLGEEYLLDSDPFTLGRQQPCNLVFDGTAYPMVAPRHCEIAHTGDGYILWDRSRTGTLLNERAVPRSAPLQPGDVIRLGPGGPVLRFLGQPAFVSPLAAPGQSGGG